MMSPKKIYGKSYVYVALCFYLFWPTLIVLLKNFTNLSF